jgi:CDGSH-type Zn-finger protein
VRYNSVYSRFNNPRGNTMSDPVRASDTPIAVGVEAGKSYYWCACGQSSKQPFCDGSHKDTGFTPVQYDAEESKTVYFCGCKATKNQPLCDGSHKG